MAMRKTFSALRILSRFQPQIVSVQSNHNYILQSTVLKCKCNRFVQPIQVSSVHTSSHRWGLSEFLDDEENWTQETVKVGRPWHLPELRIKSNEDLHKLWYVLLKERNMLLTMEEEHKRLVTLFPSPERIDKVEESMENILAVVEERNEAHKLLETGTTGKPAGGYVRNYLGLKVYRTQQEFPIPRHMNRVYNLLHPPYRKSMIPYIKLYSEQLRKARKCEVRKKWRHLRALKKAFPNMEENVDSSDS